jgi:diacylglycerol kinase (ATP)
VLRSFRFAGAGLVHLARTQANFVVHLVAALGALGLGLALAVPPAELALVLLTIGLVLVAEALNTALEAAVDLASPSRQERARIAKDVAAAGVLIAALVAVAVGALVFLPRLR